MFRIHWRIHLKFLISLLVLICGILTIILLSTIAYSAELEMFPVDGGYWCSDSTGRKILETLRSRRLKLEQLQSDYDELSLTYYNSLKDTQERIANLEKAFNLEREAYKKEIRRSKAPGLGVFVGPAYSFSNHSVEVVAGFGLVWKLW